MFDLVVRGGVVVTPEGTFAADVAVEAGQIAQVGPGLLGATAVSYTHLTLPTILRV